MSASVDVASFAPLAGPDARVLILGSMPGRASLQAVRYYAHPRNLFWPFMAESLGFAAEASYERRMEHLREAGVALWDVLETCRRSGSLDAAIERASERPNDIPGLLRQAPGIGWIFFNGRAAEALFNRHLRPEVMAARPGLRLVALPSTSPANQSIPLHERRAAWGRVAEALSVQPSVQL